MNLKWPNEQTIVITNYHKLMKAKTGFHSVYQEVYWSLGICDEVHALRNLNSQKTKKAFTLQRQAGLLITGIQQCTTSKL